MLAKLNNAYRALLFLLLLMPLHSYAQIGVYPPSSGSGTVDTPFPATAIADYKFLDGSGVTLADSSGNHNNGTLGSGAQAPSWSNVGLDFTGNGNTRGVQLPSALNTIKTLLMGVYINPVLTDIDFITPYPILLSSTLDGNGFNFLYSAAYYGSSQLLNNAFAPTIYGGGGFASDCKTLLSGFHVIGIVMGTGGGNLDKLYVDGVECAAYGHHGASAGKQTSGNFYLGSTNSGLWSTSGFKGSFFRFVGYTSQLTDTQMSQASHLIRREIASRGVVVSPINKPTGVSTLQAIGDSITYGQGVATPWPSLLSLANQSYAVINWGITNVKIVDIAGSESNRAAPQCATSSGPSIATVFTGTNDFTLLSTTASQVFGNLAYEIQTLKAAGCKVFVGTMISRTGNAGGGGTLDAAKNAYDALILSSAKTVGADGVIDFAANPLLGADGAYSNSTYFQGDAIHPTQAGQSLLATAASNSLNYYFGYKPGNPNIVSATTYQMLSGDGAITLTGGAGQSLTAPDCTGPSGADYTISNPQAFTATIVGQRTGDSSHDPRKQYGGPSRFAKPEERFGLPLGDVKPCSCAPFSQP